MEIDLYVINCGSQEAVGRLFMVNHSENMDAGSGNISFIIQGRSTHQKTELRLLQTTPCPNSGNRTPQRRKTGRYRTRREHAETQIGD